MNHHPAHLKYDLIVLGGGSSGFAAALAAARQGLRVLLVERSAVLGGTSVMGGVNSWEPGVGGTGVAFDLYKALKKIPKAVGIYSFGRHVAWQKTESTLYPGGEQLIDPSKRYIDTLRRFGGPSLPQGEDFCRKHWHGVPFEPQPYAATMENMLLATGCCDVWKSTTLQKANVSGPKLNSLEFSNNTIASAQFYIDATGTVSLARLLACRTSFGQESRSLYGEPSAPPKSTDRLNGTSLIYRVSRCERAEVESLPEGIPSECWWAQTFPHAACTQYPNGDFNINSLPTMSGTETCQLGLEHAYAECVRRIRAHWHHTQTTFPEFQYYRIIWMAPQLGVREGHRLAGRYVLTEHDLDAGLNGQRHTDIIAIADHAKDTHGADTGRAGTGELKYPYGVPFRCLLPREYDNLAVACRGSSFSSLAASSCRLTRTMMQLGQAAGTSAAIAKTQGLASFSDINPSQLRENLQAQHVELEWPRSRQLTDYLSNEDD